MLIDAFDAGPTLVGDLVTLRPVTEDDADGLLELLQDTESMRLTGTHPRPGAFTPDAVRRWYATRAEQPDRMDLAVLDRVSGRYVGEVVLGELDVPNRSCSFRIALLAAGRGRGFGTEATRLVVGHALDTCGLHRVSLEVYAFNPRARHVYETVGFRHEGTLRDALRWDDEWVDAEAMALLAPQWRAEHG